MIFWRIFDPNPAERPGCYPIEAETDSELFAEAHRWNSDNWGIYKTVNDFEGPRKIANLKRLNSWFVECDGEDKPKMLERLRKGLLPSRIVESKRGYHAYWNCKDATPEKYSSILEFRLIPFYGGDRKAKDIARILRVPDYFHCKNPDDKFLVREIWSDPVSYSESDIEYFYKLPEPKAEKLEKKEIARKNFSGDDDLFEKIYALDSRQALEKISGHSAVGGERYSFRKSSGGFNILVDGKSTSCWIDRAGHIGSSDRGGPTIWQWVNWFQNDHKKTFQIVKEVFPELWN